MTKPSCTMTGGCVTMLSCELILLFADSLIFALVPCQIGMPCPHKLDQCQCRVPYPLSQPPSQPLQDPQQCRSAPPRVREWPHCLCAAPPATPVGPQEGSGESETPAAQPSAAHNRAPGCAAGSGAAAPQSHSAALGDVAPAQAVRARLASAAAAGKSRSF
jgi:hypothetical protein